MPELSERVKGPLTDALAWVNAAFVGDPRDVRTWRFLAEARLRAELNRLRQG